MILVQISLALQTAQDMYGFVHWDLMPWNVIVQKLPQKHAIDYIVKGKPMRVYTDIVPVIIDYDKSHAVIEDIHYGVINMFKFSSIQDVLTILLSSVERILTTQQSLDLRDIFDLMTFITGTTYREEPFKSVKDMKFFLTRERKYSVLITSKKYELESKTPHDFTLFIMDKFYSKKLTVTYQPMFQSIMVGGNARVYFDYIMANNQREKESAFMSMFSRFIEMTDKFQNDIYDPILVYYTVQNLYTQLRTVYEDGLALGFDKKRLDRLHQECQKRLDLFIPKFDSFVPNDLVLQTHAKNIIYTEEDFSIPEEIIEKIKDIKTITSPIVNTSQYLTMLNYTLFSDYKGLSLPPELKQYYMNILSKHPPSNQIESASINTLKVMARMIYSVNAHVNPDIRIYTDILDMLK